MMSKEKMVPRLRFEEFENNWEKSKLHELASIIMGHSPSSKKYTKNPNDYILVQGNTDIIDNKVVPRLWTTKITKQSKKNDIILSVRAPVGEVAKTNFEVVLGRGVAAIRGNEFLYQLLIRMRETKYWSKATTGSTFESINSRDIKEAIVNFPSGREQNKIGDFFKNIDKMIQLQQSKANKMKDIKSAYLSEMFPKEGEKYPKKRFEGFTKSWEEFNLGKIANISTGYPFNSNDFSENGKYLVITNGNIQDNRAIVDSSEGNRIILKNASVINEYVLNKGDILVTMDGTVGRTAKVIEKKQILAQRVGRLVAYENKEFLYQALQTGEFAKEMSLIGHGGTIKHISLSEIRAYKLIMPTLQEQEKIGNFFKNLDDQISIEEEKLSKLEKLKQAYLNDMFV